MRLPCKDRILAFCLASILGLAVLACGDEAGQQAGPFRVGVMESLTGPGETYGTVASQAKQMALDEINAADGINGRKLEFIVEDSKCGAQDAITAYKKLTEVDGVKIILGTSCSGAMLGAAPLAEADGVILFSGLASNPDIANAGDYIFRTQISDIQVGIDTGNQLWADGVRTLATITETTDYAEGVRRTTAAQFEKLGGAVVAEERYASDITDFRSQLQKLFAASPDALHVVPQSEFAAGTIIKQARELGYEGPIYAETVSDRNDSPGNCGRRGDWDEGDYGRSGPRQREGAGSAGRFQGAIQVRDAAVAPGVCVRRRLHCTAECLKRTNDDQDADGFRDCMYEITWSGAIGDNYGFDEQGEVVGLSRVVVEVLPTAERTEDRKIRRAGASAAAVGAHQRSLLSTRRYSE